MAENFWRTLIQTSLQTTDIELNCGECFDLLDQYVDLLDAGKNPSEIMPDLAQHLTVCYCCQSQLEALLIALHQATQTPE